MGETFVLIHGTWHGGWAWDAVVRELSGKGHRAHAPTLAGHGPGVARQGITHQDCVASVVAYIDQQGLGDVILVGHSFGGTVVQKVAELLPGRIRRTVFLDALVLKRIAIFPHAAQSLVQVPHDFLRTHHPDHVACPKDKTGKLAAAC